MTEQERMEGCEERSPEKCAEQVRADAIDEARAASSIIYLCLCWHMLRRRQAPQEHGAACEVIDATIDRIMPNVVTLAARPRDLAFGAKRENAHRRQGCECSSLGLGLATEYRCLDRELGRRSVESRRFVLKANAGVGVVEVGGEAEPHYRSFMGPDFCLMTFGVPGVLADKVQGSLWRLFSHDGFDGIGMRRWRWR